MNPDLVLKSGAPAEGRFPGGVWVAKCWSAALPGLTLLLAADGLASATAGSGILSNLPPNTAVINLNARADGACVFNSGQSLWYQPFRPGGPGQLLTYTVPPAATGAGSSIPQARGLRCVHSHGNQRRGLQCPATVLSASISSAPMKAQPCSRPSLNCPATVYNTQSPARLHERAA